MWAGSERAIYTTSNAAAALGEFDIGQLNGFPKSKVKLLEAAKIIVFCFPALYHKKWNMLCRACNKYIYTQNKCPKFMLSSNNVELRKCFHG